MENTNIVTVDKLARYDQKLAEERANDIEKVKYPQAFFRDENGNVLLFRKENNNV